MMRTKRFLFIFIAATVLISFAAMDAGAEKVFKLGTMGPYTGPAAQSGANQLAGTKQKFEEIGWKIGDYKIEHIMIDSQSDPAKGASAFTEAVERKGMQAVVGGWHSSVAIACADLEVKYGIPHISTGAAAKPLTEKIKEVPGYHLKFWSMPAMGTVLYYQFFEHLIKTNQWKPKSKQVALSAEETDWGRDWVVAAKDNLKKFGWEIVAEDYVQMGQTDFYPLLSRYKNMGVPLVMTTNTAAASISAYVKQIRELGLKGVFVSDGLTWIGEWYKLTGRASNGFLDLNAVWTPRSEPLRKNIKKNFGFDPTPSACGFGYDAAGMFIKIAERAIEKHKELTSKTILQVIKDEVMTGKLTYGWDDGAAIMKEYKYTPETYPDPQTDADHWFMPVVQFKSGKQLAVFPESVKMKEFELK
jgi:branched-chain amino acid transport system substrate-binding protein